MSDSEEELVKESKYVKLVSSDGFEFIIPKELAKISPTLSSMLDMEFEFQESKTNRIKLGEIDSVLLEKVVEYLHYNKKYGDKDNVPEFEIPTEMALELLVAADFLNI